MSSEYVIPYDAAENISLCILRDHQKMVDDQLEKYYEGKQHMNEVDVVYYRKLSKCISTVVDYFGK